MIKAIIFDLDDTLYDEMQFVKGGFRAVSAYLIKNYKIKEEIVNNLLLEILEKHGRGKIFNITLNKLGIKDEKLIPILVDVYRNHIPNISLYPQVEKILKTLKKQKYKIGLITDGNPYVQRSKVRALRINNYFDCMIFSDDYGIEKRKPDLFPYKKSLKELDIDAKETIYVGDNPYKDFFGAKKIGIHTVRLKKGYYKEVKLEKTYEANHQIAELNELLELIKNNKVG